MIFWVVLASVLVLTVVCSLRRGYPITPRQYLQQELNRRDPMRRQTVYVRYIQEDDDDQ